MQELENTLQSSGGFKRANSGDSTLSFLLVRTIAISICIPRLRRSSVYLELYIQSLFQLSWTVHPLFSLQMEKRATQRQ